jgi:hypothetical protein
VDEPLRHALRQHPHQLRRARVPPPLPHRLRGGAGERLPASPPAQGRDGAQLRPLGGAGAPGHPGILPGGVGVLPPVFFLGGGGGGGGTPG